MGAVTLQGVFKMFGNTAVVEDLNLEVADGEFMVLLGPSGCGKTTTLRMIAGLESATSGEIIIDGRVANDVHPSDRDIAMVFQNYALYPHMTVRQNLGYALRRAGVDKGAVATAVGDIAASLGLVPLLDRKPSQLSGGQRQRVALGRAVIRRPKVFLMDEPLSNLDAKLRVEMRNELVRLQARLGTTTIYVTHDQVEAMTMGHRVAVMNRGRLEQVGSPLDLFERPVNQFVAGFMGHPAMNMFRGAVVADGVGRRFAGEGVQVPLEDEDCREGEFVLGIRPQYLRAGRSFDGGAPPADAIGQARVDFVEHLGTESFGVLTLDGRTVVASVNAPDGFGPGDVVWICGSRTRVQLFDVPTGARVVMEEPREARIWPNDASAAR